MAAALCQQQRDPVIHIHIYVHDVYTHTHLHSLFSWLFPCYNITWILANSSQPYGGTLWKDLFWAEMYRTHKAWHCRWISHSHDHRVLNATCSYSACGNLVSSQDRTDLQADLVDRGLWIWRGSQFPKSHGSRETGRDTLLLQLLDKSLPTVQQTQIFKKVA